MSNPQLENGHIDMANEIAEALAGYRLSGEEWQVLWVIIRKTWGWHKKTDMISLSQFSLLTKLLKPCISRSIKKLLAKQLITFSKSANPMLPNTYGFNKHYDQWVPLAKQLKAISNIDKTTISKNATHKRKRYTKEKDIRKEIYKEKYGEFENVLFTVEEYQKLINRFGEPAVRRKIEDLSQWLKSTNKHRSDHYATILGFFRRDGTPEITPDTDRVAAHKALGYDLVVPE